MPVILLDRLPLPKLKTYVFGSLLALSACIYYATQTINDPNYNNSGSNDGNDEALKERGQNYNKNDDFYENVTYSWIVDGRSIGQWIYQIFFVMIREPICVWTMINMAFCWLILIGRCIQKLVFGELRVSERQHLKDKFWNFVFYKFIFVFGVINVQYVHEVLLWCSWFSFLGFLHLLSQLGKDRFEYLSFSPTTPIWNHAKLLVLLGSISALSGFMLLVSVFVGFFNGFNTFAFMSAEVILLGIRTLHVILRYVIHLYDMRQENLNTTATTIGGATVPPQSPLTRTQESSTQPGTSGISSQSSIPDSQAPTNITKTVWEKRNVITYYIELTFELSALIIDFVHHVHMLLWSNIFLSMASLVICMQLRYLFHEIQRRFKKHRNYLWVRLHLERNYPMATSEELAKCADDNCAICWEKMQTARKLPCTHLFHNGCLQSWLEQDTSCPTCRLTLSVDAGRDGRGMGSTVGGLGGPGSENSGRLMDGAIVGDGLLQVDDDDDGTNGGRRRRQLNHFFHFDGSRYVSWLPSFSVEVSHAHLLRNSERTVTPNSQLDAMARQVQQLFPHIPLSIIIDDLRVTRSVEVTIENVLDSRITVPPGAMFRNEQNQITRHSSSSNSSLLLTPETSASTLLSPEVHYDDFNLENIPESETSIMTGSRFSKSSSERERILQRRKEHLIQTARKRYIEKQRNGSYGKEGSGGEISTTLTTKES